jgi:hypothetical protein
LTSALFTWATSWRVDIAPNVDSECTGTMLRDFLRASNLQRIDEQVAVDYERAPVSRP